MTAPVADLAAETTLPMSYSWSCSGELAADEESVFYNQYGGTSYQLYRVDLADPTEQHFTGLSSTDYSPVRYLLRGDSVYGLRVENDVNTRYPVVFLRTAKRVEQEPERLFTSEPGVVNFHGELFALLGNRLAFVGYREPRLIVKALANAP